MVLVMAKIAIVVVVMERTAFGMQVSGVIVLVTYQVDNFVRTKLVGC